MTDLNQANLIDSVLGGGEKDGYHYTITNCSQSFNVDDARTAGYSIDQILGFLDRTGQFNVQAAMSSGYSEQDVFDYIEEAQRNGKQFTGPANTYRIVASPIEPGQSGQRAFCSDQSGVIRYDPRGSASSCTGDSPALGD